MVDGRICYAKWRAVQGSMAVSMLLSMALMAYGCAAHADRPSNRSVEVASAGGCHTQVIVTFVQSFEGSPPDSFVAEISRVANVSLAFVRAAGPGLYVYRLDSGAAEETCDTLLARLRDDERVRSVDYDGRRHAQQQSSAAPVSAPLLDHSPALEVRDA